MKIAIISLILFFFFQPQLNVSTFRIKKKINQVRVPYEKAYLQTDKPLYQPGDKIWFKIDIRKGDIHLSYPMFQACTVHLLNPKGETIANKELKLYHGKTDEAFDLSPFAQGGVYTLKLSTALNELMPSAWGFSRKIIVQSHKKPVLFLSLEYDSKTYSEGDNAIATLTAKNLSNEPLNNATYSATIFNGQKKEETMNGAFNEKGQAVIHFPIPKNITAQKISLSVRVDNNGVAQNITKMVPLCINAVKVHFYPEGGTLVPKSNNYIAYKATMKDEKTVSIEGFIKDETGNVITKIKSYHNGMGKFDFIPQPSHSYFLHLTKPAGIKTPFKLPGIDNVNYNLRIVKQNREHIIVQFMGPKNKYAFINTYMADSCVFEKRVLLDKTARILKIPTTDLPAGVVNITLSDKNRIKYCERLLFIHKEKLMKIKIEADKEHYLPREKVTLNITTLNDHDKPVEANLSLKVVNKKVILSADDKQDNIVSWFLLGSEVKGNIEEPVFYFQADEPKADTALDLLMMTHGWKRYEWNPDINIDTLMGMTEEIRFEGRLTEKLPLKTLNDITIKIYGTDYCVKPDRNGRFVIKDLPFDANYYVEAVDSNNKRYKLSFTKEYKRPKTEYIIEEYYVDDVVVEEEMEIIPTLYEETGEDIDGLEYEITREEIIPNITNILTIANDDVEIYEEYEVEDINFDESVVAYIESEEELEAGVFFISEEMPEFPGGTDSLIRYISTNAQYPTIAKRMCIEGKVYIRFVIRKDGLVDQVSVARGVDPLLDHEASRVVQNLPRWKPGKQRGKAVDVWYTVPILFTLEGNTNIDSADYFEYIPQLRIQAQKFSSPQYTAAESQIKNEHDFRETLFWQANVQTNKKGQAKVSFYTSDEITSFIAQAEGISETGVPGVGEEEFASHPPIGMTIKNPDKIIAGDKIMTPVILANNTDSTKCGMLTCTAFNYQHLKGNPYNFILKPRSQQVIYPQLTSSMGQYQISARYELFCGETTLSKNIFIHVIPNGFKIEKSISSSKPERSLSFLCNDIIEGSLSSRFISYFNTYAELEEGISSIIREPYGCFEQTSSSTYPNILALQLMQKQKNRNTKIQNRAYELIEKGYDRLISFECTNGGFDLFGQDPPSPWLSAYGLLEFTEMQKVYPFVDTAMISRTKNYLLSLKLNNGQFNIPEHNKAVTHAYLCYAMSQSGIKEMRDEIMLANQIAQKSGDIYLMSLAALAFHAIGDIPHGMPLVEKIKGQIHQKGWANLTVKNSITHSGGQSLKVESAALALSCLMKYKVKNQMLLSNGAKFLFKNRSFGGFGSTQATILALKALTDYSLYFKPKPHPTLIHIGINEKRLTHQIEDDANLFTACLDNYFNNGKNDIKIEFPQQSHIPPYSIDLSYKTLRPPDSKKCKLRLISSLSDSIANESQNIKLKFTLENKTQDTLSMPLVKIGIPCGLQPQSHLISEITETQGVDFFELFNNYAVFYFRTLMPHEQKTIFIDLTALFPGHYTGLASEAYLYYHPEQKVYNKGLHVSIKKGKDM